MKVHGLGFFFLKTKRRKRFGGKGSVMKRKGFGSGFHTRASDNIELLYNEFIF